MREVGVQIGNPDWNQECLITDGEVSPLSRIYDALKRAQQQKQSNDAIAASSRISKVDAPSSQTQEVTKHPEEGAVAQQQKLSSDAGAGSSPTSDVEAPLSQTQEVTEQHSEEVAVELGPITTKYHPKYSRSLRWLAPSLALVVLLLGAWLFQLRRAQTLRSSSTSTEATSGSLLGLKVERSQTDWQVTWNRNATAIIKATGGSLLITDGPIHKELDLDSNGLRTGSIVYTPVTDDVVLQLEIWNSQSIPNSEFVHILGGQLSALVQRNTRLTPSHSSNSISPLRPAEKKEAQVKADGNIASAQEVRPVAQAAIAESRVTDQASTGNRTQPIETAAESSTTSSIQAAPVDLAALTTALPVKPELEPQIRPQVSEGTQGASGVSTTVERGGKIEAAELISRTAPVYPAIARRSSISGSVEVHFQIGADGKVHNATAVSGSAFLARAAIDAVQAWRYKPAHLNGVPINSSGTAIIEFTLK
jgi:TonB family protein